MTIVAHVDDLLPYGAFRWSRGNKKKVLLLKPYMVTLTPCVPVKVRTIK